MTLAADIRAFDVCGPLPTGVTVLEASAGTGKTYTIAALAARYVAEGTPLEQLLLVTFTRMATGELRERVRERLVTTERGLSAALAGQEPVDAVVALLATGDRPQVAHRRERLARALADFDAATITTTHGFCQEALGGLGIAGDLEPDATFVEDVGDLVEDVVDDLYVRRWHGRGAPQFDRAQAMQIARIAIANSTERVEPEDAGETTVEAMKRRFALVVRDELELRKRRAAIMTYDDLLTRLDDALAQGPEAGEILRARYRVVLVDEFQDTDPVQWRIMRRAFGDGGTTLVLIGDPKQAIYAFRGADVYAYLDASRYAASRATLAINWRSDQALIDAYDVLFGRARLGHEGIVYRPVRAADPHQAPRLVGAPVSAALRVRVVARDQPPVTLTNRGYAGAASAREHVARDLAADVAALLSSHAQVADSGRVRPGHVAVLVRTHRNAALVRDALDEAGIPAVINGAGSVFASPPARDWLRLLEALERPASAPRARSAALTPFVGWSTERVASAGEEDFEELHRRLHQWARVLRRKGVAALTETLTLAERLPEQVLRTVDGERELTDLRHVAQLLHAAATGEQMGAAALTSWLRRQIAEAGEDTGDEDRSRRLESDAEAVQVLTIHRSKGVEFPVVYCPDLWQPTYIPDNEPVFFHDPDRGDERVIDVGVDGPDFARHKRQHDAELRGEDLRLAYVALTRARHQAVVWWAGSWDSRNSALGRLLFARDDDGNVEPSGGYTPSDAAAIARFETLAAEAPGCISVERAIPGSGRAWAGEPRMAAELSSARFDRQLDWDWRRTSYSAITAGAYEARVASEPEERVVSDEEPVVTPLAPVPDDAPGLRAVPSLLATMPSGVQVGTFVHRVFEAADFAATDLDAELAAQVAAVQTRRRVEIGESDVVVTGLRAAIETPLGSLLDGGRLRDVARADRLDELDFELPLVGGDAPTARVTLTAIAGALRAHLPTGDPLAAYADRLEDPALRQGLRGYVTGILDLVVRSGERFAVVDYKTNWLAPPGEELSAWHYRPSALAAEMQRSHYVLQALLYTVALHRYLRWRLAAYDPERNLAGVLYLFLRGMVGADTPVVDGAPCGVFGWRPPAALVELLSDVLERGT